MKTKIFLIIAIFGQIVFTGCSDQLDSEGISKITYYPTITLKGERWNRITQGGTWTDLGVTAMEGETELTPVIGGDVVDVNTPGVYVITYTATNKDGFSLTEYRYIGVISPNVEGIDLTGSYKRNAGAGGTSTVTKVGENIYTTDNIGGVAEPGATTTVHFYHYADGLLGVPYQLVVGSPFFATDATVDVGVSYSWLVVNPGYGTALRTFEKQ